MEEQTLTTLSTADILDKEFRTELRGYSTNEVDDFLDEIINDYKKMYDELARLTEENLALKRALEQKDHTASASGTTKQVDDTMNMAKNSNYDILKRVSLLEKQVSEIMNHLKKRAQQEALRRAQMQQDIQNKSE